jgi:hypothetical protein
MMEDRFLKRLRKKARKGLRGWPIATVAFYGPNLRQATKVTVGIVPSENAEVEELRDWKVDDGEIRADPRIVREILEFIESGGKASNTIAQFACPSSLGSFCQKSRLWLCLIETTTADFSFTATLLVGSAKTERHKRRLILPARIRAETGYGDGVAPKLRSGHEPEGRLPQPRPEQRAGAQLAQAAAAGARAVAAAHPWGRVVAELLQPLMSRLQIPMKISLS